MDNIFFEQKGVLNQKSRLELDNPVENIMSAGGDERIRIDERTGLNKYGCAPYPRNAITYASSTASSITASAYKHVNTLHYDLLKQVQNKGEDEYAIYKKRFDKIRNRVRSIYSLDSEIDIAFGPSGTDLELAVLAFSLLSEEKKVNNIIVGLNEVGSGAEFAASGQHFAELTALDCEVNIGTNIAGFKKDNIELSVVDIRDESGKPKCSDEVLSEIGKHVKESLKKGYRPLIHIVHRSKTGLIVPKWKDFRKIIEKWGDKVDIVVDACQGRISTNEVNNYLNNGASVLLTGSKFFAGAPFSGVSFIPPKISDRLKRSKKVPKGLDVYFTRPEWPSSWQSVDNILRNETNFGLLFRWESALYEMQRLMAVSDKNINKVIDSFVTMAIESFKDDNHIKLDEGFNEFKKSNRLGPKTSLDKNTIATLIFDNRIADDIELDLDRAKKIHQFMYKDLSSTIKDNNKHITSLICHLGQPVECEKKEEEKWKGSLRIALSSPQIYELAFLNEQTIKEHFRIDFNRIKEKLNLILDNYEKINNKMTPL